MRLTVENGERFDLSESGQNPMGTGRRTPDSNLVDSRSDVGFRIFYQWQIGKVLVEPSFKAAWEHEYLYSAASDHGQLCRHSWTLGNFLWSEREPGQRRCLGPMVAGRLDVCRLRRAAGRWELQLECRDRRSQNQLLITRQMRRQFGLQGICTQKGLDDLKNSLSILVNFARLASFRFFEFLVSPEVPIPMLIDLGLQLADNSTNPYKNSIHEGIGFSINALNWQQLCAFPQFSAHT
jgi:hypothetical protein